MRTTFQFVVSLALAGSMLLMGMTSGSVAQDNGRANGRRRPRNPQIAAVADFVNPADTQAVDQLRRLVWGHANGGGRGGRGRGNQPPEDTHTAGHFEWIGGIWPDRDLSTEVVDPILDFYVDLDGFPEGAAQDLLAGFDVWEAETEGQLFADEFVVGDLGNAAGVSWDGINTVSMGNLGGSFLAVTYFIWDDANNNRAIDAGEEFLEMDIIFSAQIDWATNTSIPTGKNGRPLKYWWDLQSVAAHEVGHVIGLDHPSDGHSEDSRQTMYATIPAKNILKRDLEPDGDIPGVQSIFLGYGEP